MPQTSVAPTFKLTLPSEFVISNLSHLIDQSFDLTDKEGKDVWRVALLPRKYASFLPCSGVATSLLHECHFLGP